MEDSTAEAIVLDEIEESIREYAFDGASGVVTRIVVVAEIMALGEEEPRLLEIYSPNMPTWIREGMLHSALYDPADPDD